MAQNFLSQPGYLTVIIKGNDIKMKPLLADESSGSPHTVVKPFKKCPVCETTWKQRDHFVTDAKITLIGYQANFVVPRTGFFLFNHTCGGSISLGVELFADLYDGPVFEQNQKGSEDCPGYCLHKNELRPCPAECECAFVREILAMFL